MASLADRIGTSYSIASEIATAEVQLANALRRYLKAHTARDGWNEDPNVHAATALLEDLEA